MIHHFPINVSIAISLVTSQLNVEMCQTTLLIGVLNVILVEDFGILLTSVDREEINGVTSLNKEILCVLIATNMVTLQDSIETRIWIEEVWYTKAEICRKMIKEKGK